MKWIAAPNSRNFNGWIATPYVRWVGIAAPFDRE
jgi:hypothetical protein